MFHNSCGTERSLSYLKLCAAASPCSVMSGHFTVFMCNFLTNTIFEKSFYKWNTLLQYYLKWESTVWTTCRATKPGILGNHTHISEALTVSLILQPTFNMLTWHLASWNPSANPPCEEQQIFAAVIWCHPWYSQTYSKPTAKGSGRTTCLEQVHAW